MEKTYYFANDEYIDAVYVGDPVCIDRTEVQRLASEWDMTEEELMDQLHEATADEIEEFGVYDS